MKPLLKISFLFLLLISCNRSESETVTPTIVIPSTQTLPPQLTVRQNEIKAIWENGGHARGETPVDCEACHEMQGGIIVDPAAWQNPHSGTYEALSNLNTLCGSCHVDSVVEHTHAGFACIHCHD
ncbi:MAG: cytochrome c3 family protein, partial [Legionella sp.]|nr:cytochrome c3 family protein [Legionella sp.]